MILVILMSLRLLERMHPQPQVLMSLQLTTGRARLPNPSGGAESANVLASSDDPKQSFGQPNGQAALEEFENEATKIHELEAEGAKNSSFSTWASNSSPTDGGPITGTEVTATAEGAVEQIPPGSGSSFSNFGPAPIQGAMFGKPAVNGGDRPKTNFGWGRKK